MTIESGHEPRTDRDLARQARAMRDRPVTVRKARIERVTKVDARGVVTTVLRPVGEPETVGTVPALRYREAARIIGRFRNTVPPD